MPTTVRIETHIDWEAAYEKYGDELRKYEQVLQDLEYKHGFQLTPGAVEVIFVPLIEVLDLDSKLDEDAVRETLTTLFQTMKDIPDGRDTVVPRRSSWSVIKAYWKNWCDIPPICRATEKT